MLTLRHDGFLADLELDEAADLLRGEVRDVREQIVITGRTVAEVKADMAEKVAAYRTRCSERGIDPFACVPERLTSAEFEDELAKDLGLIEPEGPAWPHSHRQFYDGKAWLLSDAVKVLKDCQSDKIPAALRLPIDDLVDQLRARKRSPCLLNDWRRAEFAKDLPWFVRSQVQEAFFNSKADPRNREYARDFDLRFIADAQRLLAEGREFFEKQCGVTRGLPTFSRGLTSEESSDHYATAINAERSLVRNSSVN